MLSVRGLAERTGFPSTVHLLWRTIVSGSLLVMILRAGYRPGPLLSELSGLIIDRTGLVDAFEGSTEQRGTDGEGDRERRWGRRITHPVALVEPSTPRLVLPPQLRPQPLSRPAGDPTTPSVVGICVQKFRASRRQSHLEGPWPARVSTGDFNRDPRRITDDDE